MASLQVKHRIAKVLGPRCRRTRFADALVSPRRTTCRREKKNARRLMGEGPSATDSVADAEKKMDGFFPVLLFCDFLGDRSTKNPSSSQEVHVVLLLQSEFCESSGQKLPTCCFAFRKENFKMLRPGSKLSGSYWSHDFEASSKPTSQRCHLKIHYLVVFRTINIQLCWVPGTAVQPVFFWIA